VSLDDEDDFLLASVGDEVFVGARVALVLAESRDAAISAAREVRCSLTTSTSTPESLLSSEELEAALAGHFDGNGPHGGSKGPRLGLPRNNLLTVKHGAISFGEEKREHEGEGEHEGSVSFGMQKHFHMETHAARCVPGENTVSVESSAQDLTAVQRTIAKVLKMSANAVVCSCRRAGGAFGGKLSLNIAAAVGVAVAAKRTGKPVRLHADRLVDMLITGGREPTHASFAVLCDSNGNMTSYKATITVESGCAAVDSVGDLAMALAWSDNAYNSGLKHDVQGRVLKTSAPRNSSMRSPGVLNSQLLREVRSRPRPLLRANVRPPREVGGRKVKWAPAT
jgi:xanthine dehydrogenase molybdopterin-binding subunit B